MIPDATAGFQSLTYIEELYGSSQLDTHWDVSKSIDCLTVTYETFLIGYLGIFSVGTKRTSESTIEYKEVVSPRHYY